MNELFWTCLPPNMLILDLDKRTITALNGRVEAYKRWTNKAYQYAVHSKRNPSVRNRRIGKHKNEITLPVMFDCIFSIL